ncbi:gas vesicle protein GvpG [Streptomyces hesseae]|uniref:Gas vesicle protein GvpG n=1 Tax=Streptomyces hesseae TaxID=3075519 RepID=A0ABU2SQI4_9ACTN|nr:gas vesicle protein GvpG [Streptomyces sp. DSM 40473]MDT0451135.1 gas vesicle protein GvpG [Streptomyces sp. DSM 40473]
MLVGWVLRSLLAEAERLYYDPAVVQGELRALGEELEAGRVDEAEFDRLEDALLDRLEEARRRSPVREETQDP